jgi:hypothetical protein
MDPYAVGFSVAFLLGAAGGMAVMYVAFYDRITTAGRALKTRTRVSKPDSVQQELDETQAWLGAMREEDTDSIDLKRYRPIWGKKVLLEIAGRAKQLAITSKPHGTTEMARIARHMNSRPKPLVGPKFKQGRRRLAEKQRQ